MTVQGITQGGIALVTTTAVFFFLASVIVALRFVARKSSHSIGIDDWSCLASYILLVGLTVCHLLIGGPYGFVGAPMKELSAEQLEHFQIMLFADNIFYSCTSPMIKITIVLLYRRIFVIPIFKHITFGLLCILVAWLISVLFVQIFSCTPVKGSWKPALAKHCIDTLMFYNAVTISNVILDWTLLILPIPMVWQLNMTQRRKIIVCGIFLVGIFTCVCSIMRTITLQDLQHEADFTATIWKPGLWTIIECTVGIICACLPPLANLFRMWHQKTTEIRWRKMGSNRSSNMYPSYNEDSKSGSSMRKKAPNKAYLELSERQGEQDVELALRQSR